MSSIQVLYGTSKSRAEKIYTQDLFCFENDLDYYCFSKGGIHFIVNSGIKSRNTASALAKYKTNKMKEYEWELIQAELNKESNKILDFRYNYGKKLYAAVYSILQQNKNNETPTFSDVCNMFKHMNTYNVIINSFSFNALPKEISNFTGYIVLAITLAPDVIFSNISKISGGKV